MRALVCQREPALSCQALFHHCFWPRTDEMPVQKHGITFEPERFLSAVHSHVYLRFLIGSQAQQSSVIGQRHILHLKMEIVRRHAVNICHGKRSALIALEIQDDALSKGIQILGRCNQDESSRISTKYRPQSQYR